MDRVATLTLNPAIDSACEADKIFPTHKIRTFGERYDPGGGGINVARVLARLGERVEVIYLAGGATGALLDELLDEKGIDRHRIGIHDHTRMSLAVYERSSGQEFRFVPEGPLVSEGEWQQALAQCASQQGEWLVASGSLPRGVPEDFFARLAHDTAARGARLVLDTSGPPLAAALEAGGLFLVKPSQGEFEQLTGRTFAGPDGIGAAALELVRAGKAQHVAVTLGHEGAVLAHAGGVVHHPGLEVTVKSATGAGDSFVAGMVHGFLRGEDGPGAFRWGLAAGTAAVLNPGTGLAHPNDVARLWARLE
ncbi:MAG TPA: 1-phosphofructokinase family hexose kinase [Novosphingobium sp.]